MDSIFSILGHDVLAEENLRKLISGQTQCLHLSGATGTGKTNIAFSLAEGWRSLGGVVLASRPNKHSQTSPLVSLSKLNPYKGASEHIEFGAREGLKIAEKLLGTTGVIAKVFEQYEKGSIDGYIESSNFQLLDSEADIIYSIRKTVKNSPFLILIDDAHYTDDQSLSLLKKIRKNYKSIKGLEFFENARYLFISTIKENDNNITAKSLTREADQNVIIEYCSETEMPKLLEAMGVRNQLSVKNYHQLYKLTSGHLRLLKEVSDYLTSLKGNISQIVASEDNEKLAQIIIKSQFLDESPSVEYDISVILTCAASIGKAISRNELNCLAESLVEDVRLGLKKAESKKLIIKTDQYFEFPHSCIQNYFKSSSLLDTKDLHIKFSDCIKYLSPGDYGARAAHLKLGGETSLAEDMWVLEWLKLMRSDPSSCISKYPIDTLSPEKRSIFINLAKSIVFYHQGDFPNMRSVLEETDIDASSLLNSEREYLLSLSLALIKLAHTRSKSLEIVKSINVDLKDEFDLASRVRLLEIYLLSHQGKRDEAIELEEDLLQNIKEIYSKTPFGMYLKNVISRRCEQLYPPEVSISKLKEANIFWLGSEGSLLPRYPQEYYRTTSNLVASLIYVDRSEEAEKIGSDLINSNFFKEGIIQRPEYIINNNNLACFLNGSKSPKECFNEQVEITESRRSQYDNLISLSNLSVYAAYDDNLDFSYDTLIKCWSKVNEIQGFEIFFRYLIGSNLFALSRFMGRSSVISIDQLQTIINEIDPNQNEFESQRFQSLINFSNNNKDPISIKDWDTEATSSSYLLGPSWNFFGRRLLLSGIHSWVDI